MKKGNIKLSQRRRRRGGSIRKKISGTAERPRLAVFRSNGHIYAQIVDDVARTTLLAVSTKTKDLAEQLKGLKGKIAPAKVVGAEIARRAKEQNITRVVFDRKGYLYHGRVKALADGAREGGLEF
jgi:large subunit ribosomal protein L18